MKKCILTVFAVILIYMSCEGNKYTYDDFRFDYPVYLRNMSTVNGVTVTAPSYPMWGGYGSYDCGISVTLDPAPQSGVPVDSIDYVYGPYDYHWTIRRVVDSVVIATGYFVIDGNTWVLIEETDGNWRCTWSNEPIF